VLKALLIDGSPRGAGRTHAALRGVGVGIEEQGGELLECALGSADAGAAIAEIERADVLVIGSPVYRASFAAPLKTMLDALPRGMWGEPTAPLRGRAVALVVTGATLHHFRAIDDLRNVLAGFFAAHVVPPGLYVPGEGFDADGALVDPYKAQAALQGRALVELAAALDGSPALAAVEPQA
jgi:FMN reductase